MVASSARPSGEGRAAPRCTIDLFSEEMIADPFPLWEQMRGLGPIVYLEKNGVHFVTSHALVQRLMSDWRHLTSTRGIGIRDNTRIVPARAPSLLLETDPPEHSRFRNVMMRLLSPGKLAKLRADFQRAAAKRVEEVTAMGEFDGLADMVRPFTLNVIGDAVGIPQEGREHLLTYGAVIVEASGPDNARFRAAVARAEAAGSYEWVARMCKRHALSSDGLAAELFQAADRGEISEQEAELLVRIFLSAAVDSTIYTLTNGLKLLAEHPEQWSQMHANPALARDAFEETLRMHAAPRWIFRTTNQPIVVEGVAVPAGEKVGLGQSAANRDPTKFPDPAKFVVTRKPSGHVGFGVGIHACAGQMVARLEGEVLYGALAERVQTLELAGTPEPLDSHSFTSWQKLPLRVSVR